MRWLALALLLGGCSSTNLAEIVQALAQDDATVCVRTHVIYGIGNGEHWLYRTKATNVSVKCDEKGMSVTTGAPP